MLIFGRAGAARIHGSAPPAFRGCCLQLWRPSNAGWARNGFDSVDAIHGLKDATHAEDVDALIRAQYVAALTEYLPGKLVQ